MRRARMMIKPPITLGTPSLANIMTEKQKALAKLNALAPQATSLTPRTTGNAMIAADQLSHAEWMRYRSKQWGVFKFLSASLASGISALFNGISHCQPGTIMADTGADIMLVTEEFCTNMGLTIGPTVLAIHTSVSGLGGLMYQITQRFEIVLALGTDEELRVPMGPGTFISIVGVAPSNPVYQILLCQAFYHITGGRVNPVIGRFTYLVNLWEYNDSSVIGTLEGVSMYNTRLSRSCISWSCLVLSCACGSITESRY
jgi:hypothetical protein